MTEQRELKSEQEINGELVDTIDQIVLEAAQIQNKIVWGYKGELQYQKDPEGSGRSLSLTGDFLLPNGGRVSVISLETFPDMETLDADITKLIVPDPEYPDRKVEIGSDEGDSRPVISLSPTNYIYTDYNNNDDEEVIYRVKDPNDLRDPIVVAKKALDSLRGAELDSVALTQ